MSKDKYALELERAIFNWYYGGENAAPESVFNAVSAGLKNDMQMMVPIELPQTMLEEIGDPEKIKAGDIFSVKEDIHIKFKHLAADENGHYFIPLFTSREEMEKGETASTIVQPLKDLFEKAAFWESCVGYIINPWDKKLVLQRNIIGMLSGYEPKSHINFVRGSVIDMHVGAIVNAANTSLLGGGGVDGAIHKAAGIGLLNECRKLGGCKTGEAKITGAYNIKNADCIIHTVGPVYSGRREDAELLAACYTNSLDIALENNCSSIAFSGISTGVYGYPLEEAARVSLLAAVRWLNEHKDTVMNIYFCCYREAEMAAYEAVMNEAQNK
ncbi:macro domain-containing protein [Huintestinicola sp.]